MRQLWKKGLSLFLALIMLIGMMPMNALAAYDTTRTPVYDGDGIEVYQDSNGAYTLELLDGTATAEELYNAFVKIAGNPTVYGQIAGRGGTYRFSFGDSIVEYNSIYYLIDSTKDSVTMSDSTISLRRCTGRSGGPISGYTYSYDTAISVAVKVYHKIDIVTNPTTIGGVTYNDTPYTNGSTVYLYTGEPLSAIPVEGYGAVATGDQDGVSLNPTASGTLTIKYESNTADVVVGTYDSSAVSVTVNGTSAASNTTATVTAGSVTIAAAATDATGSYPVVTVKKGEETVASAVGSVTFTAEKAATYSVGVVVNTPAIVVTGNTINYNNANKTDYTTLENYIKALVTSVAGSQNFGTLTVTYDTGAIDLGGLGGGFQPLNYEPKTSGAHAFGAQSPETVRISDGTYVWQGPIILSDLRPDAFNVNDSSLTRVDVTSDADIIAQAKTAIVDLLGGLTVENLSYKIISQPPLAGGVNGNAIVEVSIATDTNVNYKPTTKTVTVPVVGTAQPAKINLTITGAGSVVINGVTYTESTSNIELNEDSYAVSATPNDTDGTDGEAGYISEITLTGVTNPTTTNGVYTNNAYAVAAGENYTITVKFATKRLAVKDNSESSPLPVGIDPTRPAAEQVKDYNDNNDTTTNDGTVDGEDSLEKKIFNAVVNAGASLPSNLTWNELTYQYCPLHVTTGNVTGGDWGSEYMSARALTAIVSGSNNTDGLRSHTYYDFAQRYMYNTDDDPSNDVESTTEKILLTWKDTAGATVSLAVYITFEDGRDTYTVTWKNSGNAVIKTDAGVIEGSAPSFDGIVPTKAETDTFKYTFAGWAVDDANYNELTSAVVDLTAYQVTSNVTFKPVFTATAKYAVTYTDGVEAETIFVDQTTYVPAGEVPPDFDSDPAADGIQSGNPQRTGYTFTGWEVTGSLDEDGKVKETIIYAATWTVNQYTITWSLGNVEGAEWADGSTADKSVEADYGTALTYPVAVREGYNFGGWVDSEGNPVAVHATMPARDQIVYANWTLGNTVTWIVDGNTTSVPYTKGAKIDVPADPTKTGYEFLGWDADGNGEVDEADTIAEKMGDSSLTYTAVFNIKSYTVTWDANGGAWGEERTKVDTVVFGGAVTAPADPTREYYSFVRWDPAVVVTMGAANVTYTAIWQIKNDANTNGVPDEKETATITVNVNDSSKGSYTVTTVGKTTYQDNNGVLTVVFDSTDATSKLVKITAVSNDTVKTDGEYIEAVVSPANVTVEDDGGYTVTITFTTYTLNASNGIIYLNGNGLDASGVDDGLKGKVLTAAGLSASGNYTVIWNGMDLPLEPLEQATHNWTLLGSIGGTLTFTITDNDTGVSKTVDMAVKESRKTLTITAQNVTIQAKSEDALETSVVDQIKAAVTLKATDPATGNVTDVAKDNLTITYDPDYAWPANATTKTFDVTVSMVDVSTYSNAPSATLTLTITDTTILYDVVYTDGVEDAEHFADQSYKVAENTAPTAFEGTPARQYYNFVEWELVTTDSVVDGKVVDDTIYKATWTPINDKNLNGIADEEDIFTVKFMSEDGADLLKEVPGLKLGDTPSYTPNDDQTPTGKYFAGWTPELTAVKAEDAAEGTCVITYKATWDNKCTVTYVYGNGTPDSSELVAPNGTVNPAAPSWGKHIFKGWSATGADGEIVTLPYTVTTSVTLTAVWGDDRNTNGVEDGTDADPFHYYVWKNGNNILKQDNWLSGEDPITSADYTYAEYTGDKKTFAGWTETVEGDTTTYTLVLVDDINNNEKDDAVETATVTVTITGNGEVELSGAVAAIDIKKNEDGSYTVVYDSTDSTNGNVINVTATPAETGVAYSTNYVAEAPDSVTVSNGNTTTVEVEFAAYTLRTDGSIAVNGYSYDTIMGDLTKTAILDAVLGEGNYDADDYTITIDIVIESLGSATYPLDLWGDKTLAQLIAEIPGASLIPNIENIVKSAVARQIAVPGNPTFTITREDGVSAATRIELTESRSPASVTHEYPNAEQPWYNASALDEVLLETIKSNLTPDTTISEISWGEIPTELVEGETYEVEVLVDMIEDDVEVDGETVYYLGAENVSVQVTVKVPQTVGSITISDADLIYNTGMTDADKAALVIEAVSPVIVPEKLESAETIVWYKAREDGTAPYEINLTQLGLNSIVVSAIKSALGTDSDIVVVDVPVEEDWDNIGEIYVEPDPVRNDKIEALITELFSKYLAGDIKDEASAKAYLASYLAKDAEMQAFLENYGKHAFGEKEIEYVYLTQDDNGYGPLKSNTATLNLKDTRTATTIKLNTGVAVTYNGYTVEGLRAALVEGVYDADGNRIGGAELVTFVGDVSGLSASEAAEVTVKYVGDKTYKGSTATGTIVVNKATVEVNVDNQVVKYGTSYNKLPVSTNPAGIDNIQFIVGLDISNVNVDTSEGVSLGAIKGIVGSVQLLLPEELQELLEMADGALQAAGLNVSFADGASMKLSELQQSVDILADVLKDTAYAEYFNVLLNMLGSLPTDTVDIEITIGGALPSNVGVYLIGAVTADSNYETAFGVGVLAIYPDGIKVELDWKMDDDNYIITRSLLTSGAFDADAEAISVGEGGTIEEATEQAYEIFLGMDIDGNLTFESDQAMLNVGAYLEIAMIVNWGNQMYYSAPIARPIVVVAETLDVDFVDGNGNINNERKFDFNNTIVDDMEGKDKLLVTYKQDGEGYSAGDKVAADLYQVKYYYVGVQTNGVPYASTTAPLHAGVYTVTAIVTIRDASGITHAGQGIGVLAIEPSKSTIDVENEAIAWTGEEYTVNQFVQADSVNVPGLTPDTTIISAGISADLDANIGLEAINGNVNIDMPSWLDNVLNKLNILEAGYADGITAETFLTYVEKLEAEMVELGVETDAFNEIVSVIKQLPGKTTVTFHDNKGYSEVGVYLIIGIVTDSDHYPSADAGIMVIYPDATKVDLKFDKTWDDNNVFTWNYLQTYDLDAKAYDLGTETVNSAATGLVTNLFVGFADHGEIILTADKAELDNGVYAQVAFVLDLSNEPYYAEPISREVVIVPNPATIDFVDENGNVNNERHFEFTNKAHAMDKILVTLADGTELKLNVNSEGVDIFYVGVQSNGMPYASYDAPVHAGVYEVTAQYTTRDAQNRVVNLGAGIGVLVIEPSKSETTVDNAAYPYGSEHKVSDLVDVSSVNVPGLIPDTTVISAGLSADLTNVSGLESINGTVNVDLPLWMDELMNKLNILEAGYADGISTETFLSYADKIREALVELGVDTQSFDEIIDVVEQLPITTNLTFKDDIAYSEAGAYLVIAVVTDSDHYPSAGAGIMVIYPDATKVELQFEQGWNDNNIFTWYALTNMNLEAKAYLNGVYHEDADKKVINLYFGFTDNGEFLLESVAYGETIEEVDEFDNGLYTQMALVNDFGNTMYYAEPISRAFVIVPTPAKIEFVDENGQVNDERIFVFDNQPHGMNVRVTIPGVENVDLSGLTITYTGIQTNLKTYNSTEAPKHAGTYVVTATYTARDEQGRLVTLGAEVGAMVILPAQADITIESAAIPYDGVAHGINDMVKVTSDVKNVTVDKTVITAAINTNGTFSENLLSAVEGSVNVDLPRWVDEILAGYENVADGVTITGFLAEIEKVEALMAENGIETTVFDELVSVLKQLPNNLTLTFEDDYQRTAVGIYLIIGAVTDSDHMPAMDVGYLIIYPAVVDTELRFNSIDANGIFTNDLMASFDFAATAFGVEDGTAIDNATNQIQYFYFGVDQTGKLVLTGGLDSVQNLPYGVYTQVAFIAEINSVIYLAEPITRPIIRVPNTVNVDFDDVVANYNGTNIGIGTVTVTKLNGDHFLQNANALTVYYAGVSSNGQPYWSETAPVHAGVYSVIAYYVDGENIGAHVGSVTILPAEAAIDVPSQAVKFGTEYDINVTVDPTDDSIDPSDAKYLLITAGTDLSVSGGDLSLSSINTINLDFPAAVDAVLEKLSITDGVTIGNFVAVADSIQSVLDKIGYESEYMTQLVGLLNQMGSGVTITFHDNYEPANVGVYFLIATVFDPDYMPAIDTGVLVIYPNGELVDIEFATPIPGTLNIMPYNTVVDFDFSAYTDKGESFDSLINNVIFGLTTDGTLFVGDGNAENYAGNPDEMGSYTQVAYIEADLNGLDGLVYVSIPEFRLFTVVKSNYDVIFVEDASAATLVENDDRIFTYDGNAHSMPAVIVDANGNKLELVPTVYYIGVDSTLDATWSTTAPTNVGVYNTVAYYFNEEANIYVMATGLMAIKRADLTLELQDTTVTYDGSEQFSALLAQMNNPNNADAVYLIMDREANEANVLLEDDLNAILDAINTALGYVDSELPGSVTVPASSFRAALSEVIADVESLSGKLPESIENSVAVVLSEMADIVAEIPNDFVVALNSEKPVDAGTYEVYAISYSANYSPAASYADLVIEPIELVITAEDKTKSQGDADPDLTYTVTANGEAVEVEGLSVTISRTEGEAVGTYTITVSAQCTNGNYEVVELVNGTLTITELEVLDAPVISVETDEDGKVYVEITAEEGATIYYTTDGSEPSATNGTVYTGAFEVTESVIVKAIAVKPGMANSDVVEEEVVVEESEEITYNVKNYTGNEDEDTWTIDADAKIINVRNDLACVVLIEHADGTYTRLTAVAQNDGSYNFDISAFQNGEWVVIVEKGDVDLNGNVDTSDITLIRKSLLATSNMFYAGLDVLGEIAADVDVNGYIDTTDITLIRKALLAETNMFYAALEW